MFYISISFILFALIGGMYLLAKTKKEELGNLSKWISYLIITVSLLLLICQFTQGIIRMACNHGICAPSENCMPGMMGNGCHEGGMMGKGCHEGGMMMGHGSMGGGEKCCGEMEEHHSKGAMKHGCGEEEDDDDAKADSTKK